MKTYFKMYCFKFKTLYFFSIFLIYIISFRLLVPADFKSFHEFKIISYYFLNINYKIITKYKINKNIYNCLSRGIQRLPDAGIPIWAPKLCAEIKEKLM